MSTERPTLFQETLQTSGNWLRQISGAAGLDDDQQTYHLLCATLWALRDRLLPEHAIHLAAQLPVLIRGLFFEGWRLADVPLRIRDRAEFVQLVASRYRARPLDDLDAGVRAVISVLSRNIDFGETFAVLRSLPDELRDLWPEHMVRSAAEAELRSIDAEGGRKPAPLH